MPIAPGPLLQPLDTFPVPATTSPFCTGEFMKKKSSLRFSSVWDEFKKRFFEKIEPPMPEATYQKHKLMRISADAAIISELGGEENVKGTVAAAFALLQRQGNGEAGFLQTNGYANIFYVPDKNGILCAIRVGWADGGWVIDAMDVKDPLAWNGQHQIFCPVK